MTEVREHRLKRVHMRSWRRGMKEMDLILGKYADAVLADMQDAKLDAYEVLLDENDQDLYKWVSGSLPTPELFQGLIAEIAAFHGIVRESATH